MSLKRKALEDVSARSSKRSTPAPATPVSLESDEDYAGSDVRSQDDASDSEKEHIRKARARLDFSSFQTPHKRKQAQSIFGEKDFSWLSLKMDHENRPLWIDPSVSYGSKKGPKITLEAFSPLAAQATDLLTTIAEPQSRPSYLHEYRFTEHSLYAALSVGLRGEDIIRALEKLSKTPVPQSVIEFIDKHTKTYGKVRLVLRNNKFYVESDERPIIDMLLRDPVIGPCKAAGTDVQMGRIQTKATVIQGTSNAKGMKQADQSNVEIPRDDPLKENEAMIAALRDEEDEEDTYKEAPNFEIAPNKRDVVAKQCLDIGYPAISEYDFAGDFENPTLPIDLRPSTQIRPYQEKALSKMFGNGRGKSGIIVLPCGAGKTLVGITAGCHIKKSIIVLCTSAMSSYQWANEFKKWSDVKEEDIAVFSASEKRRFNGESGVLVTTYSMITAGGKRAYDTQQMMDWVYGKEWGLMILDEVHVVPAKMFRKVGENVRAHCKLGLTATLLREDDKITDLNFIIGPKLYEANWMELADQGHIAKVQCAEVWCPMSMEFYQEYQKETTRKQALYYIMNPVKYQVCQYLIDYHEKRGDKIIVFSDNLFALKHYAISMKNPFIYGDTSNQERINILENFQHNELINTIFLSKIGDTSLDLPEATCLIQISSHYGSRRQEAQRLGRILRAKRRNDEGFNAFFYSLVSKDTTEMAYSAKRQAFLVDQGYAFKTITHLAGMSEMPGLAYTTSRERNELLAHVMLQQESEADVEKVEDNMWSHLSAGNRSAAAKKLQVRRQAVSMADASGGGTMAPMYREQERKNKKNQGPESEWFRKEARRRELAAKKRRKEKMEAEKGGT
ncbi:uncharacterized protein PV06_01592 [Exophiala oligosperma]|uniref:DNA 3'-5' helicase n=1 Tax=Exophiala oligosperma TaxID=215243 RepID=A0A0D2DTM7_9EURO|nr:uncharacterized protein PV06_01592 [Exophiala oligosperma]KIW45885.1 hypothetical protein PV06_01592 [Exophiala oligosperma]